MARASHTKVPFVSQLEATECGAACVTMVASAHGHHLPLSEARTLCGVARDGTSALAIVRAAESLGFEADAYALEAEDIDALPLPAIIHWELNHFVVLERVARRFVIIVDPARGRRKVSTSELSRAFSGVAIAICPTERVVPRARTRPSAERYFRALREHASPAVLAMVASLFLEALAIAFPVAIRLAVDLVAIPRQPRWLVAVAIALVSSIVLRALLTLARTRLLVGLRQLLDIRTVGPFVDHLLRLPASFFMQRGAGDLVSRVEGNIALREVTLRLATSMLDGIVLASYAAVLLASDVWLGAVVVTFALVRVFVPMLIVRRGRESQRECLSMQARENGLAIDALSAPETIRAFRAEEMIGERFERRTIERSNAEAVQRAFIAAAAAAGPALEGVMRALILWFGGLAVMDDRMTAGTFASFVAVGALLERPLGALIEAVESGSVLGAHLSRVDDVWAASPEQTGTVDPGEIDGAIRFEGVTFRYGAEGPFVLRDVSFAVRPGERVAIVGRSGAGKSTLVKLLLGELVPTSGVIRIDGRDLLELDLEAVRRRFGVVMQGDHLFAGTVRDNIAVGDSSLSIDDVRRAARLACIDDDIMTLPDGYDTVLVGRGKNLSGGQRQRLALARAVARRPRVLVLDEATSSLDLAIEAEVHRLLASVSCTRIVIAHRLATVRDADRIFVLEGGRLADQGTFDELAARSGIVVDMLAAVDS
ncbi:MAG TPA: peptidase domain-containing ABC transporter [Labilithrix sp.]|nr:peptidase domain-containing ABC transporter [Labilithrix sp.]